MAQRSRFFDSSGGDRIYTSDAWAQVVGAIIGDGVVATGNELAVAEASPPAMSVRVNTGKAFIQGYYFEVHTGQETLAIGAAHATLARIDRVVVRRDLAGRTAILAVLSGTPAASPTAPALTQVAAGVWEIALAQVAVAPAAAVALCSGVVRQIADDLDFDQGLLATRADIAQLLSGEPSRLDVGWRRTIVGDLLRRLIDGDVAAAFDRRGHLVIEERSRLPLPPPGGRSSPRG